MAQPQAEASPSVPAPAAATASLVPCTLRQVVLYFLRLGAVGFGGPIALAGYMPCDLVEDKRWISEQDYKEGLDSDNYYITRANPLEGNVRLYRAVGGDRQQLASADLAMASGQWHTLEATARGQTLTVRWDDQPVITATDATFTKGKIGLWTKADSVTTFDDLEARVE